MESEVTMETSTGSIVENRLSPVTKNVPAQQTVLTGQYLYEQFMEPSEGEVTRANLVRSWVDAGYDCLQISGACESLVKKAQDIDDEAWEANGGRVNDKGRAVDADGKIVRGSKTQQAMNVRTILQTSFGGLKFAREQMDEEGLTERTGYFALKNIASVALKAANLDWKGEVLPSDADKKAARLKREQKVETGIAAQALVDNPRQPDETVAEHMARVAEIAQGELDKARDEAEQKLVSGIYSKLKEKHGKPAMLALAMHILNEQCEADDWINLAQDVAERYGIVIDPNARKDEAEPTDEEVAAAMAKVSEEFAAH